MYFIDLSLFPVPRLHQNFILPELTSLEQFCFSLLYKGWKVKLSSKRIESNQVKGIKLGARYPQILALDSY